MFPPWFQCLGFSSLTHDASVPFLWFNDWDLLSPIPRRTGDSEATKSHTWDPDKWMDFLTRKIPTTEALLPDSYYYLISLLA